jgi:LysR family transcriptional regulator, regulator for bpeEF and oprC
LQLAIAGMGIVQSLSFLAARALREGKLERVLTSREMPAPEVSVLYPRDHDLPSRTRATMDAFTNWIRNAIHDAG